MTVASTIFFGKSNVRNPENILQYDREKILKGLKDAVKSDWEIKPSPLIIDDVQQHFLENLNSESNKIRNIFSIPTTVVDIPIVGKISAGQPILTQETIEGYLPVDPSIYGVSTAEDLFFLRVSGQSMNLKVKNGDYALIKKQDYAEDGDIVVAIVNGDSEATLKRYKKLNEQFVLLEPMSSDPSIEAITVDLKTTDFHIIGKAIGQFGKF